MLAGQRISPPETFVGRLALFMGTVIAAFVILVGRLWYLQIVEGERFAHEADNKRFYEHRLRAPRGRIISREGTELFADNRQANDVILVPFEAREALDVETVCRRLEKLIGIDAVAAAQKVYEEEFTNRWGKFHQVVIKEDILHSDHVLLEENSVSLPGVFIVARPQRRYQHSDVAAQILGYTNEVSQEEIKQSGGRYKMGDHTGRAGLENAYEDILRGQDGLMVVTRQAGHMPQLRTDDFGRMFLTQFNRALETQDQRVRMPSPGQDLHVTLDVRLQQYAEHLLETEGYLGGLQAEGPVGAIVVLNSDTGEVLAMASVPRYDPNAFVSKGRSVERTAILTHPQVALMHRAYQSETPPGSIYKIVQAIAALEEGVITPETTFYCPGQYRLPGVNRAWRCHLAGGHGTVNIDEALALSCDVFFYNVGIKLGVDRMHAWTKKMGLGVKTGIDLPGEKEGLAPSREWKREMGKKQFPNDKYEWEWRDGNTLNMSIGQGDLKTTPLQNAVMMAAVVNGGRRVRPYLNLSLGPQLSKPVASEKTLAIVQHGLQRCVEKTTYPQGTGRRARVEGITVLGKTGTAQIVSLSVLKNVLQGRNLHEKEEIAAIIPTPLRHNAWFVAATLDQTPNIAICVFIEHGHQGGLVASPLARMLIEYYYKNGGEDGTGRVAQLGEASR